MSDKQKRYRLRSPIQIPAGTVLCTAPVKTEYFTPHVMVDIDHGPDQTSAWIVDLGEALEAGIIEEV